MAFRPGIIALVAIWLQRECMGLSVESICKREERGSLAPQQRACAVQKILLFIDLALLFAATREAHCC
jgi:hypothetical protein